jgi:probable HAF family extracellular repeat protein
MGERTWKVSLREVDLKLLAAVDMGRARRGESRVTFLVWFSLGLALTGLSCGGEDATAPNTGSLEITTISSGPESDSDGYTVSVDGGAETSIGGNSTIRRDNLEPGPHTIRLSGLSARCTVDGENPRIVTVPANAVASERFAVSCGVTGNLEITTITTKTVSDPDGYSLNIDGSEQQLIGPVEATLVEDVIAGDHNIGLSNIAGNCKVEGENPRTVTVEAGEQTAVNFAVSCVPVPPSAGTLQIRTTTIGSDPDPDGYTVVIDGDADQAIGVAATLTIESMLPGAHSLELSGLEGNCAVQGENPVVVTLSPAGRSEISFAVNCTAVIGNVEVRTTTTGSLAGDQVYTVRVGDGDALPIGATATITVSAIAPSNLTVLLAGLGPTCAVEGENPVSVIVTPGATSIVTFTVTCHSPSSTYRAIDLGTLGGNYSEAHAINAPRQVVGYSLTFNGETHAFLWQDGVMSDLGILGGTHSYAYGINAAGKMVGLSDAPDGRTRAVLWANGRIEDLGTLGGAAEARDINDVGQIVGSSSVFGTGSHAFLWENGEMADLGTVPDGVASEGNAINAAGQVAGSVYADGAFHAAFWDQGTIIDLGTLGGQHSFGTGISPDGKVVGYSYTASGQPHAFLWEDGVMTDLGTLGGDYSLAFDINPSGQVVGYSAQAGSGSRAFLWDNGEMIELVSIPGGVGSSAYGISPSGDVVGTSVTADGAVHATLWTQD